MSRRNSVSRVKARTRRDSGTKLDYYYSVINKTILLDQNPATGLLAASGDTDHSWVRDNVYSIMSVWALALAYKKHVDKDFGRARAYELEQSVIKLMRGLLMSMILQIEKVEKFKYTTNPNDCLHAKYSSRTCQTVVGDKEWGHLQIDATSLYLLMLAEMTASGLQIIFTLDEVAFIQNLIFYIEYAYLIPDYGIWERGDKTNHGNLELNASSIGMAKSALVAMDELDLFGSRGGDASVIHVMPDTINWCNTILTCMLPRESNSKETDAALLSIISYPAFALDDMELVNLTREQIIKKLQGRYGCSRFIRDGYKTAKEDPSRLHYEPWELKVFENIECEWPMFWCYLILDGIFYENEDQVEIIAENLENVLIKDEESIRLVPELYAVPAYKVEAEYSYPKSQDRVPLGKIPHKWGQSLYIISKLLRDSFIAPGELDPLNKRLVIQPKPDLVVQVCVLAEDEYVKQQMLENHNINLETVSDVSPVKIYPATALAQLYSFLGKNERLGLTGRPVTDIGYLATGKLYTMKGQILAFTPSFMDQKTFYLASDLDYSLDLFRTFIAFIEKNWKNIPGRPTIVFLITNEIYEAHRKLNSALVKTIRKLNSGYINGARVQLGKLKDFIKTSCLTNLTFLSTRECGKENEKSAMDYINLLNPPEIKIDDDLFSCDNNNNNSSLSVLAPSASIAFLSPDIVPKKKIKNILGIAKRTRSIHSNFQDEIIQNTAKRPSFANIFDNIEQSIGKKLELKKQEIMVEPETRTRCESYHSMDEDDLLNMLKQTQSIHDEADILQCLFELKNLDWEVKLFFPGCTLKNLIEKLYEKASIRKLWWLVRHSAGMLALKPEDSAKAVLNLIVRQKQISFGIKKNQKNNEITIKSPLTSEQIYTLIENAWAEDISMIMVSQEILIYLSLFISTEPQLFQGMIRIRIGLIIQVMIGELKRTLSCTVEQATDHLLNLSPFELKTLLHMIISGKELGITSSHISKPTNVDIDQAENERKYIRDELMQSNSTKPLSLRNMTLDDVNTGNDGDSLNNKHGQWIRRRLLDGSLNRVPIGFYSKVWVALEKCEGIQIDNYVLNQSLTREMTKEELKFALLVEEALNRIPEPEYRQLIVEACMLMTLLCEQMPNFTRNEIVVIDSIVEIANDLFLTEQVIENGDATLCCAIGKRCPGARQICEHFYDLAPSGRYGSMNYILKAFTQLLKIQFDPECIIS